MRATSDLGRAAAGRHGDEGANGFAASDPMRSAIGIDLPTVVGLPAFNGRFPR